MCKRVMVTRDETITKSLDPEAAALSRDALAKIVYSRLFDWLVEFWVIKFYCLFSCTKRNWSKTNVVLLFRIVNKINNSIGQDPDSTLSIGVLDIYGFESFKTNRCLTGMLLYSSFTEVNFLQSAGWKFCSANVDFGIECSLSSLIQLNHILFLYEHLSLLPDLSWIWFIMPAIILLSVHTFCFLNDLKCWVHI